MTKKQNHSSPILHHARRMRHEPTKAERLLWQKLRGRQLGGYKFRRQHPIGNYIVDFYCAETKLIIEIDGDVHAYQEAYDAERTADLEALGYRVVRFWNEQVLKEMDGVVGVILVACDERG
jgi:very-short-patch-repair endonuclease